MKATKKVRAREVTPGMTIPGAGVVISNAPTPSGRVIRFAKGSPAVQMIRAGSEWVEVVK